MPLISIGNHIQKPLEDKEVAALLDEVLSRNIPLVIEHTKYAHSRLFKGQKIIEWYNIYYKLNDYEFQSINLPTDGNGISKSICLAYLYGCLLSFKDCSKYC